ncbi:class F sortase [Kitasatospora sp. NBC_00070]|uniref:class F sortase n=1 Tax=Kitasatospora sp. NBC_00070 TaxID=2975962 RepID=UPI00324A1665
MPERRRRRVRRALEVLSGALLFVALVGAVRNAVIAPEPAPPAPAQPASRPPSPRADPPAPAHPSPGAHAPLSPSTPLRISIAAIKLTAPLLALGTDSKGRPELPPYAMPDAAAWLRDTPTPGAPGAAVLAGHVDTPSGRAVFWSLSAVPAGAAVEISRLDGSTATFTVDQVRTFPRAAFPASLVYAPTPAAELRIITCGGTYDHHHHEYTDNVVLFAHLTDAH